MRTSMYKSAIIRAFKKAHLLSIADIKKRVPKADFSTIFRNVESMCIAGEMRKVYIDKDTVLYELAHSHTHDHFVCDDCGAVETIHISHTLPRSFVAKVRDVIVRGVCRVCVKK